jgi:3-hydroxy-9,10-secoandrosta-1,3,5(10)-triene-9,17-dione monooxygenase
MPLIDVAKSMAPLFAAAAAEDDSLRNLSEGTWAHLLEGGFLRALQPARWGGGEVTFIEFIDAIVEIARVSPSAGWVAGVIGVHPWQLALFDDEAQQDLWAASPAAMHSSSYNPTGKATAAAGGYRLTGRWSFSSGCDHCAAVNLGAMTGVRTIDQFGPVPELRSFLLLRDQYRIDDNWHVAGLKGTGSKDIIVDDAFVPLHRTQSHLDYATNAPLPGQRLNDGALYRLPWSVVFNAALAASVLGSARGFIDVWIEQSRDRKLGAARAADDGLTQRRLATALWALDATVTSIRADAAQLWDMAEARVQCPMTQRARIRWNMNRGCELVADAVADLMRAASGRSIYLDHPLQKRFLDLQGALGHAFLVPDPLARAVGGELLGASKKEMVL